MSCRGIDAEWENSLTEVINRPTHSPPILAPLDLGVVGRRKEARKRQRTGTGKGNVVVFSPRQVNSGNAEIG